MDHCPDNGETNHIANILKERGLIYPKIVSFSARDERRSETGRNQPQIAFLLEEREVTSGNDTIEMSEVPLLDWITHATR
jgi:hypothetical protein